MYYVYLMRCKDGSLYCGITNDLQKRQAQHNAGRGSKYVFSRGGGTIIFTEEYQTKSQVLKREAEIKNLNRLQKEKLVSSLNI